MHLLILCAWYTASRGMLHIESFPKNVIDLPLFYTMTINDVAMLLLSSDSDDVKLAKLTLYKERCDLDQLIGSTGTPLLTHLILADNLNAAMILVLCKVNVNLAAAGQITPLFASAARGYLPLVTALLAAGAHPEPASWHPTPLFIAAEFGHQLKMVIFRS
jgi:ankyrin repeat protein